MKKSLVLQKSNNIYIIYTSIYLPPAPPTPLLHPPLVARVPCHSLKQQPYIIEKEVDTRRKQKMG